MAADDPGPARLAGDSALMALIGAIAARETAVALRALAELPSLATARLEHGAERQSSEPYFLDAIRHHVYAGDTALHVAAAAYQTDIARSLIELGADVRARNRRGGEPLHYAVDGAPGSRTWNPAAQATTVAYLIDSGADPNAVDKNHVTPLHRAVRTRCTAAVRILLERGADWRATNQHGSTPMQVATRTTGRGGSGSPEAKAQQAEIVRLLDEHGAT